MAYCNGHYSVLDREQEEKKELEVSVAAFKRQLASFREKCSSVEAEIEQQRAIAANLQRGMCSGASSTMEC